MRLCFPCAPAFPSPEDRTPMIVGKQQHYDGEITVVAVLITLGWCDGQRVLP